MKIRDHRLGITYYTMIVLTFIYVVVYNVVIQQGYKKPGWENFILVCLPALLSPSLLLASWQGR